MRLADPLWLVLFFGAALALWLWRRRRPPEAALYSSAALLRGLPVTWAQRCLHLLPALQFLGLLGVALALSRPQEGKEELRLKTEGVAILLALDRSGSMAVLDCRLEDRQVDRWTAIRHVVRRFIEGGEGLPGRPDDLIGLVVFGGYADARCPLTLDHGALLEILDGVDIPFHRRVGEHEWPVFDPRSLRSELEQVELATAIGEAIAVAAARLKDAPAKSKVLILLSDGAETVAPRDPDAAAPLEAAQVAARLGIRIYTIAFGSDLPQLPVAVEDRFGRLRVTYVDARAGGYAVDEELLQRIAKIGKGRFFRATSTEALKRVYAAIDRLERSPTEGLTYVEYRERYGWPLAAGLALLLLHRLLVCTRFRSLP